MKELLVVASAVLVLTLLLSIPVEALQGKHLDAAISNVRSSWDAPLILMRRYAVLIVFVSFYVAFSSNFPRLQLPSEKFQKSHKKFRMFDKNHDHHIGTPIEQLFE